MSTQAEKQWVPAHNTRLSDSLNTAYTSENIDIASTLTLDYHLFHKLSEQWLNISSKPQPFIKLTASVAHDDYLTTTWLDFTLTPSMLTSQISAITDTGCLLDGSQFNGKICSYKTKSNSSHDEGASKLLITSLPSLPLVANYRLLRTMQPNIEFLSLIFLTSFFHLHKSFIPLCLRPPLFHPRILLKDTADISIMSKCACLKQELPQLELSALPFPETEENHQKIA